MRDRDSLTKRERQVLDAVVELNRASAREVQARLADPPSDSAVRAVLTRLVGYGLIRFEQDGPRYVYLPSGSPERLRRDAIRKLIDTFFSGSAVDTINALVGYSAQELSRSELYELAAMIAKAGETGDNADDSDA